MPRTAERLVPTSSGPARLLVDDPPGRRAPTATLVLGHGAGRGADSPDLVLLAATLPGGGVRVVRMEQPWVLAGRRVAAAPAALDVAWREALARLRPSGPLVVGGRSAGARVACRTAVDVGAAAVLTLAFPLHPPGRRDRSRSEELLLPVAASLPVLCVQGGRDAFGAPAELPPGPEVVAVVGADHGLRVARRAVPDQGATDRALVAAVASWLHRVATVGAGG